MEILGSSDALIGRVGGATATVKKTGTQIAVTSALYSTGCVLGTTSPIQTEVFRIGGDVNQLGSAILQSVIIKDLSKQSLAVDVIIFDSNPTATTFTNNSVLDIADADIDKIVGIISILATDYVSFNDNSVAIKTGIGLPITTNLGNNIWFCLVTRGSPTYVANELSVTFGLLQD